MRFLIRDRGGKFSGLFDAVLTDAGIKVVFTGVRMPRMNALMERWSRPADENFDRTLIWNQRHLLHALRSFEAFYNHHRPIKASRTPGRYIPCHRRSPTRTGSPS